MLRRFSSVPRIVSRQSNSSSITVRRLLIPALKLSTPVVSPKRFFPEAGNLSRHYFKGISAFQDANYEEGYAEWMAVFPQKKLKKENQECLNKIFELCKHLNLKISDSDFEIFFRYHDQATMLKEIIFNACCKTNDLKQNQDALSKILKHVDKLLYLRELYRWLNAGELPLGVQKNRNRLIENIVYAEHLVKILPHVSPPDVREVFDLLMGNASYISYVADKVVREKKSLTVNGLRKMLGMEETLFVSQQDSEANFAFRS